MIDWETDETYLDNIYWIETVVVKCLITALGKCFHSRCLQIKFLEILTSCEFSKNLTGNKNNNFFISKLFIRLLLLLFNYLSIVL